MQLALDMVSSTRTRIEREFDPEAVWQLKARAGHDISVGGPELAAHAIKAGLVDEYHLFVHPIVVGGGKQSPRRCPRESRAGRRAPFRQRRGSSPLPHQNLRRGAQRNEMRGRRIKRYGVMALDALTEANQDRPFADLVTPLVPAAQRLAYGMLQNAHDSEDAVQEATFKAWRAFPRLREGSNHRAWFLTIVANECKQRRRNRWWSILKLAAPDHQDPAPQGLDGTSMDLRRAVSQAL
jgi:hypothetical protein